MRLDKLKQFLSIGDRLSNEVKDKGLNIRLDKLKEFLSVADALSDEVKDMKVNMNSISKPTIDKCGCHAGLFSIIAKDLPELQEIYNNYDCYHSGLYSFVNWGDALSVFLGFENVLCLEQWAKENPDIWGNNKGERMLCCSSAFTGRGIKPLKHRDIIDHWHKVVLNIENGGKT